MSNALAIIVLLCGSLSPQLALGSREEERDNQHHIGSAQPQTRSYAAPSNSSVSSFIEREKLSRLSQRGTISVDLQSGTRGMPCPGSSTLLLNSLKEEAEGQPYSYDALIAMVGKTEGEEADKQTCKSYFDVDSMLSDESNFWRFNNLKSFGDGDFTWQMQVAKACNRVNFYQEILAKNEGHWATTSLTGMLTIMKMLEVPLRSLWLKSEPTRVMDAGSGSGALMAALLLMTPMQTTVMGIEYDQDMAKKAADWLAGPIFTEDSAKHSADWAAGKPEPTRSLATIRNRIEVLKGDAMKMSVCRQLPANEPCTEKYPVPEESLDILILGFGLFEDAGLGTRTFPETVVRVVKKGGYILIPVCVQKSKDHDGYCLEQMTVFQRPHSPGPLLEKSDFPKIQGKFFYLGADPAATDANYK